MADERVVPSRRMMSNGFDMSDHASAGGIAVLAGRRAHPDRPGAAAGRRTSRRASNRSVDARPMASAQVVLDAVSPPGPAAATPAIFCDWPTAAAFGSTRPAEPEEPACPYASWRRPRPRLSRALDGGDSGSPTSTSRSRMTKAGTTPRDPQPGCQLAAPPFIEDAGAALFESLAITLYLAQRRSTARLYPGTLAAEPGPGDRHRRRYDEVDHSVDLVGLTPSTYSGGAIQNAVRRWPASAAKVLDGG